MNLSPEQLAAVNSEADRTLTIAAAGSGKTRVLVHRVAELLRRGASPNEIMVLTFTRKAAKELTDRLAALFAEQGRSRSTLAGLVCGTFHAVSLRILRTFGTEIGWDPERMSVCDVDDADGILQAVAVELGYAKATKGKLSWSGGLSWDRVKSFRERCYTAKKLDWLEPTDERKYQSILDEYHRQLREMNVLDFGLLLYEAKRLLDIPHVRATWNAAIKHVLVDELQDTDEKQYDLHDLFAPPATFFGVGDPRQAIYSWRGARPDLLLGRKGTSLVCHLRDCYRCGDAIVDAANLICMHIDPELPDLIGKSGKHGDYERMLGMAESIVVRLTCANNAGYPWSDMAVLCRSHKDCQRVAQVCDGKVPTFVVDRRARFGNTDGWKLFVAMLRVAVNPRDRMALARARVVHFDSLFDSATTGGECDAALTYELWSRSFGIDAKVDSDWVAARMFFASRAPGTTLAEHLDWYMTYDAQDDSDAGDAVTVSTVHAAKGLEWPFVLVFGLNEGNFPSGQAVRNDPNVAEERRLAYVAMTRAKTQLVLHYREQHPDNRVGMPSRFLAECGALTSQACGT